MILLLACLRPSAPTPDLLALPSGQGAMTPVLLDDVEGPLLLWQEPQRVLLSRWSGVRGWSTPETVVASEALMQNWADFPQLARGGDGALYVSWLRTAPGEDPYAYDIHVSRSEGTWTDLGPLHRDGIPAEHGFVSLLPVEEGVQAWWLDGRFTPTGGPTALRTATVTADGAGPDSIVDDRVCDCCRTAATLHDGEPVVLYRDRSPDEYRDVAWAGSVAGRFGDAWQIAGCPVNGPVAVPGFAAWFTDADGVARVRASVDLGPAMTVAPGEGEPPPVGRSSLVALEDEALVFTLGSDGSLSGRRFSSQGVGPAVEVGMMAVARASGFPTTLRVGDEVLTVWSDPEGLVAARTPVARFGAVEGPLDPAGGPAIDAAQVLAGLSLTGLDGEAISLEGPVLVALWATWCPPCREELALLQQLHEEGVPVVAISVDEARAEDKVRAMTAELTLPVAHAPEAASALGLTAVPATYLLDEEGDLIWSSFGVLKEEDPAIQALPRP